VFKVSVITINFNNRLGLQRTMQSVLSQTLFDQIEYIIIDGGSDDGSKVLLTQFNEKLTYWISEADNGIYHAMNKGILHSTGEYLLFLNSGDCLSDIHSLFRIIPTLKQSVVNYFDIFLDEGGSCRLHKSIHPATSQSYFKSYIHHQAILYPRTLMILYDEKYRYASDWLLNYTLLRKGILFHYIPVAFVMYDTTGLTSVGESVNKTFAEKKYIKTIKFPFAIWQQHKYSIKSLLRIIRDYIQLNFIKT